jgi:hypothetical protein
MWRRAVLISFLLGIACSAGLMWWHISVTQAELKQRELSLTFKQGMLMEAAYLLCQLDNTEKMPERSSGERMTLFFQARQEFPGQEPPCLMIQRILARQKL